MGRIPERPAKEPYEGLTAFMQMDFDELNRGCAWDVHSYVIEGLLPPIPELPAE